MSAQRWHVDPDLLAGYARGGLDLARASSVEAHVLACPECRHAIGTAVPPARLARMWEQVADRIDPIHRRPVERVLLSAGVPEHAARLLAATRSLTASWLMAVAFALGFAVLAAHGGGQGFVVFLTVAPLVPLAGVFAAYGPGVDPTYEIGVAAPMRSLRLLLIRSIAVIAVSCSFAAAAALALPQLDWRAAAWLVPALGLSSLALAASSRWSPRWAFGTVAAAWIGAVVTTQVISPVPLIAFRAAGQLAFAVVGVAALVVVFRRRESFEQGRPA